LRMIVWTKTSVAQVISGLSHRKNGTRKREVCSAESTSVDPRKMSAIQITAGIQYLTNLEGFMFKISPLSFAFGNPQSTI